MLSGQSHAIDPANRVAPWLRGGLALSAVVALVMLERRRPLRPACEAPSRHDLRNLMVAAASALAIRVAEKPVVGRLAKTVEQRRWGLLQQARLPAWLNLTLGAMLMDYTLYVWHVLTHRVPWLWRFHVVHHADLDLSATTATRFHFAEMLLSVPWRAAQVLLLGIGPRALAFWQKATLAEILFQHSNVRLPLAVERRLVRLIVTPRMHGIHHSTVREETDANWSSGLTLWDWLHGTLRLNVPQRDIDIGVPAWRDAAELTLPALAAMPFHRQRPSWRLLGTAGRPSRMAWPAWPRIFPDAARSRLTRLRVSLMEEQEANMDQLAINDDLVVGTGQPQEATLRTLAEQGFRSVVDLRQEGESKQILSPGEERRATETAGMTYAHLPVPTDRLDGDLLAQFYQGVSQLPKPVFIHCASGKRSGSLAFMHDAIHRGQSGEETLARAEQAGVLYGSPAVREQIRTFVDRQRGGMPAGKSRS